MFYSSSHTIFLKFIASVNQALALKIEMVCDNNVLDFKIQYCLPGKKEAPKEGLYSDFVNLASII